MQSATLRTAVLALMEVRNPSTTDRDTLLTYAEALEEMGAIADAADRHVTGDRYRGKAYLLRLRAV